MGGGHVGDEDPALVLEAVENAGDVASLFGSVQHGLYYFIVRVTIRID